MAQNKSKAKASADKSAEVKKRTHYKYDPETFRWVFVPPVKKPKS